ncbi:MAG: class I SAM-dependent methyltransferase [Chitinophagaceae bacterium]|nr:class I SAM-dependent methyltransferase [Chitinophagaceae bacterium]
MGVGIQTEGTSSFTVKEMALKATAHMLSEHMQVADIGCGRAEFAELIKDKVDEITLFDFDLSSLGASYFNVISGDLNNKWPLSDTSFDFVYSLEVIEHIENPRFFIREITRVMKDSGYAFITTPNNTNLISRLFFLFKGQHRYFQDASYPAHISALMPIDMHRIAGEVGLRVISVHHNHHDVLPLLGVDFRLPFPAFSDSIGFLLQKV